MCSYSAVSTAGYAAIIGVIHRPVQRKIGVIHSYIEYLSIDFGSGQVYAWCACRSTTKRCMLEGFMAKTLPIRFQATIVDEQNVQALCSAYVLVDPTASFADIEAVQNTWIADLDACTDGQIIECRMDVNSPLPSGLKAAAVTGSRVEQCGNLSFTATGDTHKWLATVPALANNTNVISAGKPVTTSGKPLNTLYTLMIGGGTSALTWTNATQQSLASFVDAFLAFRTHSRQLSKRSFERS